MSMVMNMVMSMVMSMAMSEKRGGIAIVYRAKSPFTNSNKIIFNIT